MSAINDSDLGLNDKPQNFQSPHTIENQISNKYKRLNNRMSNLL